MSTKKVVVLRDFSYTERPGEEELAIERFLQAAPDHVSVSAQPPKFTPDPEFISNADILLTFGLKKYSEDIFDCILNHPYHVHVEQDWWEPIQPNSKYRNQIAESADLVIFSSPLHQERYERLYDLISTNWQWVILPPPLQESDLTGKIMIQEPEQQEAALWCAPWHPDYGNDLMLSWARENKREVHVSGLEAPNKEIGPYVQGIGKIGLDVAGPSLRAYDEFIYFPRKPVPFGFAFFLAYQQGLKMTYSGEIGCLSFETSMEELADECLGSTTRFWEMVAIE